MPGKKSIAYEIRVSDPVLNRKDYLLDLSVILTLLQSLSFAVVSFFKGSGNQDRGRQQQLIRNSQEH